MTKRPVWSNGWVFVYELSGSGFESSCNHLNFKFHACFEQVVPWHSGNCRVWIHSETRTWHDKSIQSIWDSNMRISVWKKSIFYYFISSQYEIQRSPCSSLVSQGESLKGWKFDKLSNGVFRIHDENIYYKAFVTLKPARKILRKSRKF